MGEVVILPEESPDTIAHFRPTIVPLVGLHISKFSNQRLVYHEMLSSVRSR